MPRTRPRTRTPKVSVVIPTYNRAFLLEQAIESIVNQTLTDLELIIADDASTDNTRQMVQTLMQRDPRIHYYRHSSNQGAATARNTALDHARGTYIAFQDDDDVSHPHRLQKQADELDKHPHIALLYARLIGFSAAEPPPLSLYRKRNSKRINYATAMGPRAILQKVGFRPFFTTVEDLDFTLRVTEYCQNQLSMTGNVEATLQDYPLYAWRGHGTSPRPRLGSHPQHAFFYILCTISRAHRLRGLQDPVDNARTADDVIRNIQPQLFQDFHTKHGYLKELLTDFTLRHMDLSSAKASPQSNTFYARQLLLRFSSPLWRLAPKILFACLRRGRLRFMLSYLRALLKGVVT